MLKLQFHWCSLHWNYTTLMFITITITSKCFSPGRFVEISYLAYISHISGYMSLLVIVTIGPFSTIPDILLLVSMPCVIRVATFGRPSVFTVPTVKVFDPTWLGCWTKSLWLALCNDTFFENWSQRFYCNIIEVILCILVNFPNSALKFHKSKCVGPSTVALVGEVPASVFPTLYLDVRKHEVIRLFLHRSIVNT